MARPPKPTAAHVLAGSFDDRRHENRGDVLYADKCPEPLGGMHTDAAFAYKLVKENTPVEILRAVDALALDMLCTWWAKYVQARDDGDIQALKVSTEQFTKLAVQFGLSPVSRCKLLIEGAAKRDSNENLRKEFLA